MQQKLVDAYFCQGKIEEPVYDSIFSNNPPLKMHSNKEHDNEKLHPPNPEIIENLLNE